MGRRFLYKNMKNHTQHIGKLFTFVGKSNHLI